MSRKMVLRVATLLVVVGGALALVIPRAETQLGSVLAPERETLIYNGDLKADSGGIDLTSWGSGQAQAVAEQAYVGPEVLKVTSHGPYQGVVLRLRRPRDLTPFIADRDSYVELRILPAQAPRSREERQREREREREQARTRTQPGGGRAGATPGGGAGGGRRGGGGMGAGGGGRGGRRGWLGPAVAGDVEYAVIPTGGMAYGGRRGGGAGGRMGAGGAGGRAGALGGARAGGRQAAQPTTPQARPTAPGEKGFTLSRIRVELFTDAGRFAADSGPVSASQRDQRGWQRIAIPLVRFRGVERAHMLHAVGVYADQADSFYLGQIKLTTDRTPVRLTVKVNPSITSVGRIVDCVAEVAGGALDLDSELVWDFDQSDGLQRQAVGREVKYVYKKAGDYIVTCTLVDRSGVREPISQSAGVRVESGGTSGG